LEGYISDDTGFPGPAVDALHLHGGIRIINKPQSGPRVAAKARIF